MEIKLIKIDNESYFVYQSSRKVYKERVADIMYFARGGRRVTIFWMLRRGQLYIWV